MERHTEIVRQWRILLALEGKSRGMTLADLVEEGNIGLLRAVEKFDPEAVVRDINEDRKVAGFTEVRAVEPVEEALAERRREYRRDFLPEGDRLVARADAVAEDGEFIAAEPRG